MVPSSDGKRHYEVHANGSCTCPSYLFRHAQDYTLCKHGKALKAYLEERAACPACGGRGRFVTQFRYASGSDPIPCVTCDGTGRREGADPRLLAIADQFRAEQGEASLRDLFR